jgi:hypothetical protein
VVQADNPDAGSPAITQPSTTHALPTTMNHTDWRWDGQRTSHNNAMPAQTTVIMTAPAEPQIPCGPDGLHNITMGTTVKKPTIAAIVCRVMR